MLNVSSETKSAFLSDTSKKTVRVVFPDLGVTVTNDAIVAESLKLTEAISTKESIEFVGCISSRLEITLFNVVQNVKSRKIEVYIRANNTDEIPLFKGYVDSVVIESSKQFKTITAYDELYSKASDIDIASWYNALSFPMTFLQFRNSLFSHLGITQATVTLPNDTISIRKQYIPSQMNALDTIKNICQFNGVFGIINREGKFDYISLSTQTNGTYPSTYTFPSMYTFPSGSETANESGIIQIPFYKKIKYEDFDVYAINKVLVRDSEDDVGISYETGDNVYIVQGNIFTIGLSDDVKAQVAKNIYDNVNQFNYTPINTDVLGLPFLEVGSIISVYINDYTTQTNRRLLKNFYVMSRSMRGIQSITDNFVAEGEQFQKVFLSDIGSKLDSIQRKIDSAPTVSQMEDYVDSLMESSIESINEHTDETVAEQVSQMETPTGFNVVSVYTLPTTRQANTIYLIQGGVIIQ